MTFEVHAEAAQFFHNVNILRLGKEVNYAVGNYSADVGNGCNFPGRRCNKRVKRSEMQRKLCCAFCADMADSERKYKTFKLIVSRFIDCRDKIVGALFTHFVKRNKRFALKRVQICGGRNKSVIEQLVDNCRSQPLYIHCRA